MRSLSSNGPSAFSATGNDAEAARVAAGLQPTFRRWEANALQARLAAIVSDQTFVARMEDPWDRLTPAELEVVTMLASGLTNAEIARDRGTSTRTVETQIHRTYQKLGVSSRTRLAVEAAQRLA